MKMSSNFNFKETARNTTLLSPLMVGREKISTDDIIKKYPDGFTVLEFDIVPDGKGKTYPVFTIAEDDELYYCGGIVLNKIAEEWIDGFNGDVESASNELKASGGVKFKLEGTKTKAGNNLTNVTIV